MVSSGTTKTDFEAWLTRMGGPKRRLSDKAASEMLGMSRTTVRAYREGASEVPLVVALACSALALGLPPWKDRG